MPLPGAALAGWGRRMLGGFGWRQHAWHGALQPLGRGFRQASTPRLSRHSLGITCLGALVPLPDADRVDMAPGQREGSPAFGSLGALCKRGFSAQLPPCYCQHLAPAPRAWPSEAVDKWQPWGRAEQMPANPSHLITVWSCCYL